ncbi:MAG: type II toxin-antitoxin system HipA family toxin [Balneolaceae bacterium]|nr:MAG: type II toxin-antitoxin system HipA family toxin [Balneolaceae bacterium]
MDTLTVFMDRSRVGTLAISNHSRYLFEYDPQWLRDGFSISPVHLPLESGLFTAKPDPFAGLFGVFNDSLPDGWGNLIINRWLRENGVKPDKLSWIERLALVGRSGMGALCYEPEIRHSRKSEAQNLIHSLEYYASEVEKIVKEEPVESLDELVEKAGSPGGARPKVLLEIDNREWLIKFRAEGDPKDIGELEFLYSQTAKVAGIDMPETRLFEGKYFGTERFDRKNGKRIHMITASGLLHASHRYPSLDYADLMKATFFLTRSMVEVKKVYRLMVFNVLTHNRDDHTRNFSFLCNGGEWVFAPAYDLVYSHGFRGNHSTTVLGNGTPDRGLLLKAGKEAGISRSECHAILDQVEEAAVDLVFHISKRRD